MKNLKSTTKYKLYSNGEQFLEENEKYLKINKKIYIETAFFFVNAQKYKNLDQKNYAFQFKDKDDLLLILKIESYNMLLFGSKNLCGFAAKCIADLNLSVESVFGEETCIKEFLNCYQALRKGTFTLQHSMKIMVLEKLLFQPNELVFQCGKEDLNALATCYCSFQKEIFHQELKISQALEIIKGKESTYFAIKKDGNIVSIAAKTRDYPSICAISYVFTLPDFRNHGYAKQVVSKVCENILAEGKTPYLFVDATNPISNQLYFNMGFVYLNHPQVQYLYQKEK